MSFDKAMEEIAKPPLGLKPKWYMTNSAKRTYLTQWNVTLWLESPFQSSGLQNCEICKLS